MAYMRVTRTAFDPARYDEVVAASKWRHFLYPATTPAPGATHEAVRGMLAAFNRNRAAGRG